MPNQKGSTLRFRNAKLPAVVCVVTTFAVLSASHQATAASGSEELHAEDVLADVREGTPDDAPGSAEEPVDVITTQDGFEAGSSTLDVEIPVEPDGDLQLTAPGEEDALSIDLPDLDVSEGVATPDGEGVVYGNEGDGVDMAVVVYDEGVQVSTVINDASSPESYPYDVEIADGESVEVTPDGSVVILDENGDPRGYMSMPWATDANGAEVPTEYVVDGSTVTQVVDHHGRDLAYPIVADPYLFRDMIKTWRWDWIRRSPGGAIGAGWTIRVTPTKWARAFAGAYVAGHYGWRELRKKAGINLHAGAMRDQWICHQQFVALYRPGNRTWNLDRWRRDVSYAETVRWQCNPPRGGPYVRP